MREEGRKEVAMPTPDPWYHCFGRKNKLERAKMEAGTHGKVLFPHLNFSLKLIQSRLWM